MVKLYRWNRKTGKWQFVNFGIRSKSDLYTKQGYIVVY